MGKIALASTFRTAFCISLGYRTHILALTIDHGNGSVLLNSSVTTIGRELRQRAFKLLLGAL
jgi:hypothetical protein